MQQKSIQRGSEDSDVGNWIMVGDGDLIEGVVISAGAPVTLSLLGHHVECRCPVAGGGFDDTQLQHVLELLASSAQALG